VCLVVDVLGEGKERKMEEEARASVAFVPLCASLWLFSVCLFAVNFVSPLVCFH
jgi:hypothetical protein